MAAAGDPPEKDIKDFEFRQLCKCRVYPSPDGDGAMPGKRSQQLAASSKFGLVFCAFSNEIKMIRLAALSQLDQSVDERDRSTGIVDAPCDRRFTVPAPVLHIAISCDDLTLSVVTDDGATLQLLLFDLRAFADQTKPPAPFARYQLAGGSMTMKDLTWNPAFPSLLAVCVSDGTVTLFEVTDAVTVKASAPLPATCLSWSPKGKQIMVGKSDGSSSQYDHELKLKKDWSAPAVLPGPHLVTDMVWISTYTFLGSYLPQSADPSVQPIVVMTVSTKEGNVTFINFDDVCFGSAECGQAKYFFHYIVQWEMIVLTSCASTETTIIAKHLDDKTQWEHWNLEDSCRAELPVTESQSDSFPLGMAVTFASQQVLQLGDSKTHPPSPILLLLSTDGVLVPFHMAYFHPQAPLLTAAPQPLPAQGARTPAGGAHSMAAPPPYPAGSGQTSGSALAGLLANPPSTMSSLFAPPAGGGGLTFGQLSTGKPLFGQPASTASVGASAQSVSAAPSFSFAPVAAAKTEGGATLSGGFAVKPQAGGTALKTSFFPQPAPQAVGNIAAGALDGVVDSAKDNAAATIPFTAPRTVLSAGSFPTGGTGDAAPTPFSFSNQSNKSAAESSVLGPRPAAPPAAPGFGIVGGAASSSASGFGQFSFSYKPTATTTTAPTPSLAPAGTAAVSAPSAGATFPSQGQSRPPLLTTPAAPVATPTLTPAVAPEAPPAATIATGAATPPSAASAIVRAAAPAPQRNGLVGNVATASSRAAAAPSTSSREERDIDARLDTAIAQDIAAEIEDFENELRSLRTRMSQGGPMVGTKEEMQTLTQKTKKMEDFCKEITATTKEHCREMYELKGSCLDLFAMAEECRCRQERNKDPQYLRTLQQRTLDPATAQRMRRLHQAMQQLEQGLQDTDAVLDSQWEAHIEKEKKMRIRIPNSDTLYRAIKSNHSVLVSRQHEVERLQDQLKRLQLKNQTSTWDNSTTFNNSTDSRVSTAPGSITPQSRDWRLKKAELLTPEKVSLLKESLANHRVRKVRCQPLTSLSQSRLVSIRSELRPSSNVSSDGSFNVTAPEPAENGLASANCAENGPAPVLTSTPASSVQQPARDGQRATQQPTSFSGIAYFKPKPTLLDASSGIAAQPGVAFAPAPPGTGAIFKNPQMQASAMAGFGVPSFPAFPNSQLAAVSDPPPPRPAPSQVRYENVTPTSFPDDDETYDEDEDYAGYEEEDEEEDEEEAGFGDQYEYPAELTLNGAEIGSTTPASSLQAALSLASKLPGSGVSKNLFNVPTSEATDPIVAGGSLAAFGAGGARGSSGFAFGSAPPADNSALAAHLAGKPLFAGNHSAAQDEEKKHEAGEAPPTSVFGSKLGTNSSAGCGFTAVKTTAQPTATTTAASTPGLFGTKPAAADSTSTVGSGTAAAGSKTGGGLFGFSTVPSTTTASAPGAGLFGAGATFGAMSAPAASAPSSPPVGFFATAGSKAADSASGFSFTAGASTTSATNTTTTTTAAASVFGGGSSVFGGSGAVPSFSSLLKKTEGVTSSSNGGGDAGVSSSQGSVFGKPALLATPASSASGATAAPVGGSVGTADSTTAVATATSSNISAATTASTATASAGATGAVSSVTASGAVTSTSTTGTSLFSAASSASATGSLFGTTATSAPGTGLFGSTATSTPPSTGSLFGSAGATTTTAAGLFGSSAATTTAPPAGLFGSPATTTTASASGLFGSAPVTTTASSGALFGSAATTTSGGLFGTAVSTTSASGNVAPSGGSLFATPSTTGTPSIFGNPASSAAPGASLFATVPSSSGGSLFGSTDAPNSIFGSGGSTQAGGSVFGGSSTASTTASSTGFGFGQSGGQSAGFGGFTQPAFGSSPGFGQTSSGFGQSSSSAGGFGQTSTGSAFGSSGGFGQTTTSTSDSSSGGGFGSLFGGGGSGGGGGGLFGLGAKPSEEKAKQNVFGSVPAFGTPSSVNNSLFGNKGPAAFGTSSTPSSSTGAVFGSGGGFGGATSSGTGVASMGFAVTQTTANSTGGFGSSPGFGSGPAFGGAPAFGSTPAFGGSPGFGSSVPSPGGGAFGSTPSFTSPFGASSQTPTSGGFSNFAATNTPTFGSLAQSTDAPSFGSLGQGGGGGFGGGGFATQSPGFGASSPGFGGGQQQQQTSGFGQSSFGSSPSFSSYRG